MLQVPKLDKINASPQRTEDEHTCRINKQWERDALVVTVGPIKLHQKWAPGVRSYQTYPSLSISLFFATPINMGLM